MGKEVITLCEEWQTSGNYKVTWDGKDKYGKEMSSGIYYYRLQTASFVQTRKMVFLK